MHLILLYFLVTLTQQVLSWIVTLCVPLFQFEKNLRMSAKNAKIFQRKVVHVAIGTVHCVLISFLHSSDSVITRLVASFAMIVALITFTLLGVGRPKLWSIVSVQQFGLQTENRREILQGPYHYCLMLLMFTMVVWIKSPMFAMIFGNLLFGDGFAAIVGLLLGKHVFLLWYVKDSNGHGAPAERNQKSLEGFLGFVFGAWIGTLSLTLFYNWMGVYSTPIPNFLVYAGQCLVTSIMGALVEFVSPPQVDNLTVTIATFITCYALYLNGATYLLAQ